MTANENTSQPEPPSLICAVEVRLLDKIRRNAKHLLDDGTLDETLHYFEARSAEAKLWGCTETILTLPAPRVIAIFTVIALWVGGKARIGDPTVGAKYAILQAFHPSRWCRRDDGLLSPEIRAAIQRQPKRLRP
jgi:hypothetical protein